MAKAKRLPPEILLWLAIHGGDPPPGEMNTVYQLLLLQALKDMSVGLPGAALRKEIQDVTSRAMVAVAQQMTQG
jgi:hypothetical protein